MACLSARQDPHTGTRGTGGHWSGIVSLSYVNAGPRDSRRRLGAPVASGRRAVRSAKCRYRPSTAAPPGILGAPSAGTPAGPTDTVYCAAAQRLRGGPWPWIFTGSPYR